MKKIMFLLIFLTFVVINAQVLKINTPAGNIKMSVTGNNTKTEKVAVVDKIADKLELLNKKYCSKLNKFDQRRANKIINEIYDLLDKLPDNIYTQTSVTANDEQTTQAQSLNITIKNESATPSTETKTVDKKPVKTSSAMSESAFATFYDNVNNEAFADDKLSVIRSASQRNNFTVAQVKRILSLFSFENDKIKCVQIMYPKVVDKENAHQILSSFTYSSDKKKVEKIINR